MQEKPVSRTFVKFVTIPEFGPAIFLPNRSSQILTLSTIFSATYSHQPTFCCSPKFGMAKEPFARSHVQMVCFVIPGGIVRESGKKRPAQTHSYFRQSIGSWSRYFCLIDVRGVVLRTLGCPFLLSFEKSRETKLKWIAE